MKRGDSNHRIDYVLYEATAFAATGASDYLNAIVINNAKDGCSYSDLRMRLELKKVEKTDPDTD